ncbi:hypothetical protein DFA_08411 [Cavenderia fasciculata]|uniref:Uncharacterized protein n=1 Tax=Cavenderia fasciculata TaxID=261658 RepID=F4Q607_CACFS|nr:uncharacterized protein DFA_08411 [Cavenderia fasciculata]EGG17416.1 hypothetical protein DFA_08411 [Cavenderia fasciculata]|eukprot:XP_004355900.1 hypothetical protein DFA_08411 [Cavenderia fasciculata]
MTSHLLQLSNLLLLYILSESDSNADIICLLLTCKKLYHNSSLKRSIQFKGIEAFTDKGKISRQFKATATLFNITSFKDILQNSISDSQVILSRGNFQNYPEWIQQRISADNRVDNNNKSSITTALVNDYYQPPLETLYSVPSIEAIFIHQYRDDRLDLNHISRLPNLQRLSVSTNKSISIGKHTTLKSLTLDAQGSYTLSVADLGLTKLESLTELHLSRECVFTIGPGVFPSSLTSLTLSPIEIPPRDTFISLRSLVYLKVFLHQPTTKKESSKDNNNNSNKKKVVVVMEQLFIDLDTLVNLKTLDIGGSVSDKKYNITTSVPPSIRILTLFTDGLQIPTRCTMPLLEKLNVQSSILIGGRISLLSSPLIKKLCMTYCNKVIPSNIIPSTLEKLTIYKYGSKPVLHQVVFPPSLLHLTINGDYEPVKLPDSLVKLKQLVNIPPASLPQQLKTLTYSMDFSTELTHFVFPSPYPPHLETLNFDLEIDGEFTIDIPPITKYLSITLESDPLRRPNKYFSISSRLSKSIITQQQQWLPSNTTHLTCKTAIYISTNGSFRLDEIINHTNVRYLSLYVSDNTSYESDTLFQFSIQRLDSENNNVLVLETQSLQGGIITQRKKINNTQQQQRHPYQQYEPIYLRFDFGSSNPFGLNWRFANAEDDVKEDGDEGDDSDSDDSDYDMNDDDENDDDESNDNDNDDDDSDDNDDEGDDTDINSNGDIVCLLLTCKKLYSNSSNIGGLKRLIRFKGIEVIDNYGRITQEFKSATTQFKLNSFKDILVNKETLYSVPSIETLFIIYPSQLDNTSKMDLRSISRLPILQRLEIRTGQSFPGPHPTLKSLTLGLSTSYPVIDLQLTKFVSLTKLTFESAYAKDIGPGLFPSSLTSLTLRLEEIPPRDTFLSLTLLETLKIDLQTISTDMIGKPFIDLDSLVNLKTLIISSDGSVKNSSISISIPPSIKILDLKFILVQIPPDCTMSQLERLDVKQSVLNGGNINLLSQCPSLKKLVIYDCKESIPSNIIPSTLEKLTIYKSTISGEDILGQVVFPPSLTSLTINGDDQEVPQLPDTIVSLKHWVLDAPLSLPQDLKNLTYIMDWRTSMEHFEFPTPYPPHLESLNLDLQDIHYFTVQVPPTIKYLSITLESGSRKRPNRLLDKDNLNVLVLETNTLQGGIITQQQQSHEQYVPIYLHLNTNSSNPFEIKWSFEQDCDYNEDSDNEDSEDYDNQDSDIDDGSVDFDDESFFAILAGGRD